MFWALAALLAAGAGEGGNGDGGGNASGPAPRPGETLILEHPLSALQLARNFDVVVFHSEFDKRTQSRLRRWVDPLRVYLDVRSGDAALFRTLVERHVARLGDITGHDMAVVDGRGGANVAVVFEREDRLAGVAADYFADDPGIETMMDKLVCFGRYRSNADYEIFEAVVVIPTDRVMARGKLLSCIVEETTQILGLPNDSDQVFPSIFNDKSIDEELSAQDVILVRLLYDPRLRPGMPRGTVLRRVQQILRQTLP